MATNPAADTIAALRRVKEQARTDGNRELVTVLGLVEGLIQQFVNVTPMGPEYLTCQPCMGAGKIPTWFPDTGKYLDVYCGACQGTGRTWNPHPDRRHPDIKAEM